MDEKLLSFLADRLEEARRQALQADDKERGPWRGTKDGIYSQGNPQPLLIPAYGYLDKEIATYIAHNDPAHSLRQVWAIDGVVRNLCDHADRYGWDVFHSGLLRILAGMWADHPDYPYEES